MNRRTVLIALMAALVAVGCSNVGPQKKAGPAQPPPGKQPLYEADLTKPDGPMLQMLRSAQDRDFELFKASFAPEMGGKVTEEMFKKFKDKVLSNKLTPVPASVEQVNEAEAIVKLRNSKGREVPVHVKNFEGKWLITQIDLGPRAAERSKNKKEKAPQ